MHGLGDLMVDGAGSDADFFPLIAALLGGAVNEGLEAEGLAVIVKSGESELVRDVINIAALGLDAEFLGYAQALVNILNLVDSVRLGFCEGIADLAAMVGVSGGTAGGELKIVSSGDGMRGGSAYAFRRLGSNAAGTHGAVAAADTLFTELAMVLLCFGSVLPGVDASFTSLLPEDLAIAFHFLYCCELFRHFSNSFIAYA
jgi:hypothetical protein